MIINISIWFCCCYCYCYFPFFLGCPGTLESSHQLVNLCIAVFQAFGARSRYYFASLFFWISIFLSVDFSLDLEWCSLYRLNVRILCYWDCFNRIRVLWNLISRAGQCMLSQHYWNRNERQLKDDWTMLLVHRHIKKQKNSRCKK